MHNNEIMNLLMDIPTQMCRNMNNRFVNTILKDIKSDFSQHHFMILKLLHEGPKLYVSEIVDVLSITKSQMTASVDKLIQLGYVQRMNEETDRRKIYLSITESGKQITSKIKENIELQINKNLVNLSEQERQDLGNGLKILFKFCSLYK